MNLSALNSTGLIEAGKTAVRQTEDYLLQLHRTCLEKVSRDGKLDNALLEVHQYALHGFAWNAAYVEALNAMQDWAERLQAAQRFSELEQLIYRCAFGAYLTQLTSGISMSQDEVARPSDLDTENAAALLAHDAVVAEFLMNGNTIANRMEIVKLASTGLDVGSFGDIGEAEDLALIRDQFRRVADKSIAPFANEWHQRDELIPMDLIELLSELGVFGLCIPEQYDGLGLGKEALCVVTEELSRGYIGVGSLGTRSEIAAELIKNNGTTDQKDRFLPLIASGACLPTAVFTEPNVGSDLGNLRTRAVRHGDAYKITGNKTWITHAARADLMTVMARTNSAESGYRGLSMFLAEKPRANSESDFPIAGLTGTEIPVLGYRGMKEYELRFEDFHVAKESLLGHEEGNGFKQLMTTFESARIQTAARAIGVSQNALECGFRYARDRNQFGKAIVNFPRIAGKLGWMITELMIVRQLTYRASRLVDTSQRSDIEAGMAKLLAARCAWSCADNAVQIHGGNGYAIEFPISRILCDARILNIFEGAAEIQAHVIARGLLSRRNGE